MRKSKLNNKALAGKLYWRWISQPTSLFSRILTSKYLGQINPNDVARISLDGTGSLVWQALKLGSQVVKDRLFWKVGRGEKAHFWTDSWDQFPPIIAEFPELQPVKAAIEAKGWIRLESYFTTTQLGECKFKQFKKLDEWHISIPSDLIPIMTKILIERFLIGGDVEDELAWGFGSLGVYTVKDGYDSILP